MNLVVLGLSLSSSWGNGHATTYRGLIRALAADGHQVLFLERDVPWYASQRDLPDPDFCRLVLYDSLDALATYEDEMLAADAVIVGSYVPEGIALIDRLAAQHPRRLLFYDIDTPVTLARLRRGEEEYVARRQLALFDLYLSFSGGAVLDTLEDEFGVRRAGALYCSVDPDIYRPMGHPAVWDLGYLGTYSPDRQPALERLLVEPARRLPERRFVVAGPQYPADISWPDNVDHIPHLPPAEHAGFYSRQRFTLNVTRADMAAAGWSPSVRLFEAAACGTPVLTDWWAGLDELLPEGTASVRVETAADVVAALTNIEEAERRRIGEAARTRIADGHTGTVRARQLIELIDRAPENKGARPASGQARRRRASAEPV